MWGSGVLLNPYLGGHVWGTRECGGAREVGFDDGGEADGGAGGCEFAVDADVVAAEGSGSADGDLGDQRVMLPCYFPVDPLRTGLCLHAAIDIAAGVRPSALPSGVDGWCSPSRLALDGGEAAGVEVEKLGDLVFGFSGDGGGETGGCGCGAQDVGAAGYELEQVEGDIFVAARGARGGGLRGLTCLIHEDSPWRC